jgi:hypothetical protein
MMKPAVFILLFFWLFSLKNASEIYPVSTNLTVQITSSENFRTSITCETWGSCYNYSLICKNNEWKTNDCYIDFTAEIRAGWVVEMDYSSEPDIDGSVFVFERESLVGNLTGNSIGWCYPYYEEKRNSHVIQFRQYCHEPSCSSEIRFNIEWFSDFCGFSWKAKNICDNECETLVHDALCVYSDFDDIIANPQACTDIFGPFPIQPDTSQCRSYDPCSVYGNGQCFNGKCVEAMQYPLVNSSLVVNITSSNSHKLEQAICRHDTYCFNYTLDCSNGEWENKLCFIDFKMDFPSGWGMDLIVSNELQEFDTEVTFYDNPKVIVKPYSDFPAWCYPFETDSEVRQVKFRQYCRQEQCKNDVKFYFIWGVEACGIQWKERDLCVNDCKDYANVAKCVYKNQDDSPADPRACLDIFGSYPTRVNESQCEDYQSCSFDDDNLVCLDGSCIDPCSLVDCEQGVCYKYSDQHYFCRCHLGAYGVACEHSYMPSGLYGLIAVTILPLLVLVYSLRQKLLQKVSIKNKLFDEAYLAFINFKKFLSKIISAVGFYNFIQTLKYGNFYRPTTDISVSFSRHEYITFLKNIFKLSLIGLVADGLVAIFLLCQFYLNVREVYSLRHKQSHKVFVDDGDKESTVEVIPFSAVAPYDEKGEFRIRNDVELYEQLVLEEGNPSMTRQNAIYEPDGANFCELQERLDDAQADKNSDSLEFMDSSNPKSVVENKEENERPTMLQNLKKESFLSVSQRDFVNSFRDNPFGSATVGFTWLLSTVGMCCSCGVLVAINNVITSHFADNSESLKAQHEIYRLFSPFGIFCHIFSAFTGMIAAGLLVGNALGSWRVSSRNVKAISTLVLFKQREGWRVIIILFGFMFVLMYVVTLFITFISGISILAGH